MRSAIISCTSSSITGGSSGVAILAASNSNIDNCGSSAIIAGQNNYISGGAGYSSILGGKGAYVRHDGEISQGGGYIDTPGDSQKSTFIFTGSSTGDVGIELYLQNEINSRLTLPANHSLSGTLRWQATHNDGSVLHQITGDGATAYVAYNGTNMNGSTDATNYIKIDNVSDGSTPNALNPLSDLNGYGAWLEVSGTDIIIKAVTKAAGSKVANWTVVLDCMITGDITGP